MRRTVKSMLAAAVGAALALSVTSCGMMAGDDEYPARKITLIIPYAPGGSADPVGRQYAQLLEKELGVPVVVQNRDGASGTIGMTAVMKAKPDGYTLGLGVNSSLALQPLINDKLPYSSPADYQPILKIADQPIVLAVQADAPWRDLDAFIADAKKNPGKRKVSIGSQVNTKDLQLRELNEVAGVDIDRVPLSGGGGEAVTALLAGRVDAVSVNPPGVLSHVKAGKLRILGTFTEEQYDLFPDSQSVVEAGYEVRLLQDTSLIIAPKGIPDDVRTKLVGTSREIVESKEFGTFLDENGYTRDVKEPDALTKELEEYSKTYASILANTKG